MFFASLPAHCMVLAPCSDDDELAAEQRQGLAWRFERALAAGGPGAHGGATDAAVRLSHLLKVCRSRNAYISPAPVNPTLCHLLCNPC